MTNSTHTVEETVAAIQADRDAAADLLLQTSEATDDVWVEVQSIRSGLLDGHEGVQAFARHRLASHSTPAGEDDPCPHCGAGGYDISFIKGPDKVHPYRVTCQKCGCGTANHGDAQAAAKAWRRRASLPPSTHDELVEARKAIQAVANLINDSAGVYGLHLNGDPSPWDELRTGGQFEDWLSDFDAALTKMGEKL